MTRRLKHIRHVLFYRFSVFLAERSLMVCVTLLYMATVDICHVSHELRAYGFPSCGDLHSGKAVDCPPATIEGAMEKVSIEAHNLAFQ